MLEFPLTFVRWLFAVLIGCAIGFAAERVNAQAPLEIQSATIGFDGVYKAGYWTQIIVDLKAGPTGAAGRLNLLTEDGDGVPVIFPRELDSDLKLGAEEKFTVRMYAKAGPERSGWSLQLRTGAADDVIWSERLAVPSPRPATQELIVSIGEFAPFEAAVAAVRRPDEVALLPATVMQAKELPDRVWGYEGAERVVLVAGTQSIAGNLKPEQMIALKEWVRLGGKLIFSIGSRAPEFLHPDHPFAEFSPGKFDSLDPLRTATGISQYATVEFPRNLLKEGNRPAVVRLENRVGRIELDQGGQAGNPPLVIRHAYGLGQVIFVAIELDHPTLASWNGQTKLVSRLLPLGGPEANNLAAAESRSITHLGYDDLVGQLRAVLEEFPGVTIVSFTAVATVAILLLLLIGPGDFFLIRWLNLPTTITWFTFPVVCLIFVAGAWYLGRQSHGELTRVNQIEIIDLDASLGKSAPGTVRGTLWTHLYSPTGQSWRLALQVKGRGTDWNGVQGIADWQGLPGSGLGGLASPQITLDASDPYRVSPPGQVALLDSLPVRTASSKALSGRWWGQTKLTKACPPLRTNSFGHLEGELINPLSVKLTDCLLASGEWLYRIGDLQPGQKLQLETLTALNLESRLTRRQVIDSKDLATPWAPDDRDIPRIMQMLMLHQAVRGPVYTGMSHRYQPQLDLSEHIRLSRAVLMGRAEQPVTELHLDEFPADQVQTQSWTWYRVILPVQARDVSATDSRS